MDAWLLQGTGGGAAALGGGEQVLAAGKARGQCLRGSQPRLHVRAAGGLRPGGGITPPSSRKGEGKMVGVFLRFVSAFSAKTGELSLLYRPMNGRAYGAVTAKGSRLAERNTWWRET